jgi:hypothetical protein
MRTNLLSWAGLIAVLSAAPVAAHAHGGAEHLKGTVKSISQSSITIQTTNGKELTMPLAPGAKIERAGKTIAASEVQANEKVVVHAKGEGAEMRATEINVGAMKKGSSKAAAPEQHHEGMDMDHDGSMPMGK